MKFHRENDIGENKKAVNLFEMKLWRIERYECTLVKRDREWWNETAKLIYKFWKDVEYYKKHPIEREKLKTKRKYINNDISDIDECLL